MRPALALLLLIQISSIWCQDPRAEQEMALDYTGLSAEPHVFPLETEPRYQYKYKYNTIRYNTIQ